MKKIFYAALASTMLFATSCSSDLDEGKTGAGQQATVSVNIGIPTMQTRVYSDGLTAQKLQYAVYEKTANGLVKTELGNLDDKIVLKKQINFKLVTGRTYAFVFWAANENAPYEVTFDSDGATMEYATSKLVANEETLDAFYVYQEYTVEGDGTMEAHLRRPFAQVNVGTNDYEDAKKANYIPTVSHITFSNVYTGLDLVSGEVSGATTNVEYVYNDLPKGETFPVDGYDYMAMAYVLVPVDQELVEVQFDCSTAKEDGEVRGEHTVGSVPVQRNYRTNIFGQLLTSNTEVNVIIEPEYYDPDFDIEHHNGDGFTYDAATNTYLVSSATGLKNVYAKALPAGTNVKLVANIDLGGSATPWTPIDNKSAIFDGGNHTVTGLYVDQTANGGASAGLFSTARGTVKNLKIVDPVVKGNYKAGALAGDGLCARIENVTVTGATIISTPWEKTPGTYDDANNVGGIVGYLSAEPEAYVKGCTVENSTIIAYRKIGSIVGYANDAAEVTGNTAKNVKIIIDANTYPGYSNEAGSDTNEIVGNRTTVDASNKAENVTIEKKTGLVASNAGLKAAVATEGATVTVVAGTYDAFPGASVAEGVTIECEEGTVFEGISSLNIKGSTIKGATFKYYDGNASSDAAIKGNINGNFENCNFEGYNATRWAYIAGEEVNFTNCKFAGTAIYAFHIDSSAGGVTSPVVNFKGCELDGFVAISGANVSYNFNDCVFTINASSKYGGGNFYSPTVFTNCKFYLPVPKKSFQYICLAKAGVLYEFNNCTNNDAPITEDFDFQATTGAIIKINGGAEKTL